MKIFSLILSDLILMFKATLKGLSFIYCSNLYWIAAIWFTTISTYLKNTFQIDWFIIEKIIWLVLIDTVLGIWKSIKLMRLDAGEFARFFTKVIVYGFFIGAISLLNGIKILEYLIPYLLSGVIIHEILSIIRSIAIIKPRLIPDWIKRLFIDFDRNGVFKSNIESVNPDHNSDSK